MSSLLTKADLALESEESQSRESISGFVVQLSFCLLGGFTPRLLYAPREFSAVEVASLPNNQSQCRLTAPGRAAIFACLQLLTMRNIS